MITLSHFASFRPNPSAVIHVSMVSNAVEKWPDMTVDERMQREIKGDRVVSEIVPYIVNDPEWFFAGIPFSPLIAMDRAAKRCCPSKAINDLLSGKVRNPASVAAIYTMTEVLLEYFDITAKTRRDEQKLDQGL